MTIEYIIRKTINGKTEIVHRGNFSSCENYLDNIRVSIEMVMANKHGIYKIEELDGE